MGKDREQNICHLHARDIAIRLEGNPILQAPPPSSQPQSSQPQSSQPGHLSDLSSNSLACPALGEEVRWPWEPPGRHRKWISDSWFPQKLLLSCYLPLGIWKWQFLFFPPVFYETALAATSCRGTAVLSVCFTYFGDALWEHVSQETENVHDFSLQSDITGTLWDQKRL